MTHTCGQKRVRTLEQGTVFRLFVPCELGMDAAQRATKPQADASPPSLVTPDIRSVCFRGVCTNFLKTQKFLHFDLARAENLARADKETRKIND